MRHVGRAACPRMAKRREIREMTLRLLLRVGLSEDSADKYPHEFGGQRQRIGIARATARSSSWRTSRSPRSTSP